ncbi:Nudix family hydrolase [Luteimonas aestuarii]|uniref:8-oxo-dGTP diphosphatase n=1 Tax=Luteimonas aestuarii TaxID=453837 RepID=A0A4R5TN90_9GAMM|nr:Nudix family hydrolase [Luteimonas aestuarii]TDK20670.1 Nudix family hydrolase [Luteimonas aestuarii]
MSDSARPPPNLPPRERREGHRTVHVAAGVITDPRGRILLARRTEGRDLAGLWEFPGGKVEPGETPEAALARELHEELGIDIDVGAALINVPQAYPGKRLQLDVRHVAAWRGTPKGREGQALAWVAPDKLARYPMPPADVPVVGALLQPDRYLVTPSPGDDDAAWCAQFDAALAAGIRRVQFRVHGVDADRRRALFAHAHARCRKAGAGLLVNGDAALAQASGVGLHLRAAQLRAFDARPVADDVTLAASCHDDEDLALAQALGCDFVVLGPVAETASHPGQAGIGWARFAEMRERTSLPIYAIGGMGPQDIAVARRHGAQGVAAIRGLWSRR